MSSDGRLPGCASPERRYPGRCRAYRLSQRFDVLIRQFTRLDRALGLVCFGVSRSKFGGHLVDTFRFRATPFHWILEREAKPQ